MNNALNSTKTDNQGSFHTPGINFRRLQEISKVGLVTSVGGCSHQNRDIFFVQGKKMEKIIYLYARCLKISGLKQSQLVCMMSGRWLINCVSSKPFRTETTLLMEEGSQCNLKRILFLSLFQSECSRRDVIDRICNFIAID